MITAFELPCHRCGEIRYLNTATMLCVTTREGGQSQPIPLCEIFTCHEWAIFYWAQKLNDLEKAA